MLRKSDWEWNVETFANRHLTFLFCWYRLAEIKIILLITTSISLQNKWELLPGCHVLVLFFSGMEESFGSKIPYICNNIIGNQRIVLMDYEILSEGGRDWKTSLTQRNIMYCTLPMKVSLDLPTPNLLEILTRPPQHPKGGCSVLVTSYGGASPSLWTWICSCRVT